MLRINRKPDILRIDLVTRNIEINEFTICYDLYFQLQLARSGKIEKHTPLVNVLVQLRYNWAITLCFGSMGNITKGCGSIVRKICRDRSKAKNILKWCSISNITRANYIWRNRVKKLLVP